MATLFINRGQQRVDRRSLKLARNCCFKRSAGGGKIVKRNVALRQPDYHLGIHWFGTYGRTQLDYSLFSQSGFQ
jgi:hypothetical protein